MAIKVPRAERIAGPSGVFSSSPMTSSSWVRNGSTDVSAVAAAVDARYTEGANAARALRRAPLAEARQAYDPAVLGASLGGLLRTPPPIDLAHMATPRVSLADRLAVLRGLLRRGAFSFDDAVRRAQRWREIGLQGFRGAGSLWPWGRAIARCCARPAAVFRARDEA